MKFWTPDELSRFLVSIVGNEHYPILRLASMSGLRRSELCGLRWSDVDLDAGTVSVRQAVVLVDGKPVTGPVKTKRSRRVVDLDGAIVAVLRAWCKEQLEYRMLMGAGWADTGLVFTVPTGEGWHPELVSQAFERFVAAERKMTPRTSTSTPRKMTETELKARPSEIRFHDLRHTHASHLLAAGVNIKVVSERLGHASVAFTLDTYAHVMPGQQAGAAAAVSALIDVG